MSALAVPLQILLVLFAVLFGVFLVVKILMGLGWALNQIFRFIGTFFSRIGAFGKGMLTDGLRLIGGLITAVCFIPAVIFNMAMGRWSRANHFGQALEREAVGIVTAGYRLGVGHAGRLFGLTTLTDGIERRLPEVIAKAPGSDTPQGRPDAFDGYTVVGALPTGGSGARLYLAEPTEDKRAEISRNGQPVPRRVVIKSFSMSHGSTMPQIVRESRALEAARQLGLVLEHDLDGTRFHYVMPYVPGEDLSETTQRLHDEAGAEGLDTKQIAKVLSYGSDLVQIMHRFHSHGLWHKDIKPSNIIVSGGRVHLVDLGLITPLRSAMTLTTHGTEYFRDPELVRLALRGVKVHEVDGVKFDIYGAGAVLFSLVENSFPAHGSLSQIHKRCPEALRWIIRRAMADMGSRYGSALEMLADVRHVMTASDPFAVTPASLPSMVAQSRGEDPTEMATANFGPEVMAAPSYETYADDASAGEPDRADVPQPAPVGDEGLLSGFGYDRDAAQPAAAAQAEVDPAAERSPTGIRWGSAAALLFLAVGACAVSFAVLSESGLLDDRGVPRHPDAMVQHDASHGHVHTPRAILDAPTYDARHDDPAVAAAEAYGQGDATVFAPPASGSSGPGLLSTPAPADADVTAAIQMLDIREDRLDPGVLLVLDDVPDVGDTTRAGVVKTFYGKLELARFDLIGVGREHDFDELLEIELPAEARKALELVNVIDADGQALERLEAVLHERDYLVDGILWLGPGGAKGMAAAHVITLDPGDRDDIRRLARDTEGIELLSARQARGEPALVDG